MGIFLIKGIFIWLIGYLINWLIVSWGRGISLTLKAVAIVMATFSEVFVL